MSDNADRTRQTDDSRDAIRPADRKRREISGPGAADFLAAPGGLDMPENDPAKGTRAARGDEGALVGGDSEGLAPQLDERTRDTERRWEGGTRGGGHPGAGGEQKKDE